MSKATFYEHFANKEECILALFDAAADRSAPAVAAGDRDAPIARGRVHDGVRAFLSALEAYPDHARTLLVEIIGAGPARGGAPRPGAAGVRRPHRPAEREPPHERFGARARVARRRLRDRRRHRRAGLAPAAPRPPGRPARARAGHRAPSPACSPRPRRRAAALAALEPRSSSAAAARGWSPGARRSPGSSARRSRDEDVLGAPDPRLRRSGGADRRLRPRARRARRQPHRARLHRRPVGRLPLRGAAPRRPGQPADFGRTATTAWS